MLSKNLVAAALLGTVLSTQVVFAEDGPCGDQGPVGTFLCGALVVTLSPLATTIGLTALSTNQDREIYLNQVRDDAAEYVAIGGAPSATLESAIAAIRTNVAQVQGLSDSQIAQQIASGN